MSDKPTVLLLGDSHTFGFYGASWVCDLAATLPKLKFVNTGVNGTQTKNVHLRLKRLIASVKGELAAVTLLVGTNDCLLSIAEDTNDYLGQQHFRLINGYTGPANVEVFGKHYRDLIADIAMRLRQRSAAAGSGPIKLLLVTLPPIGEILGAESNKRVDEYNALIHAATAELQQQQHALDTAGKTGRLHIALLDLSAACKATIARAFGGTGGGCVGDGDHTSTGMGAPQLPSPRGFPLPYWRTALNIATCLMHRYAFGISFGRQSALAGTVVLTPDCIHLNERGARLLAELVVMELQTQEAAQSQPLQAEE